MKLGLLTAAFPDTPLTEVADWAAGNGFSMLEVACWPRADGPTRRYAGVSHIDCADLSDDQAKEIVGDLAERGIEISALGYYPNPLHPDLDHRAEVIAHLGHVITAAAKLGVPVVNTFIGNDKDKPRAENFAEFTKVWPDIVARAADHGVKIAIENCPMIFSDDEWPGGNNLMHTPAAWREVFGYLDGDTLGLNLDPSHLVWQMIDYERVVREFGDAHLPRPRQGHGDRPRGPVRARRAVGRHGLAGPAPARARRGALGSLHQRAVPGRLRLRRRRRARGPPVRGHRREGQGRLPPRPQRRRPVHRLIAAGSDDRGR